MAMWRGSVIFICTSCFVKEKATTILFASFRKSTIICYHKVMSDDIDINNLAELARMDISDDQAKDLADSIGSILDYVESVEEVAEDSEGGEPEVGSVHNVMREDSDPHEPGEYRQQLLAEAPDTEGGNIVVPPIL